MTTLASKGRENTSAIFAFPQVLMYMFGPVSPLHLEGEKLVVERGEIGCLHHI